MYQNASPEYQLLYISYKPNDHHFERPCTDSMYYSRNEEPITSKTSDVPLPSTFMHILPLANKDLLHWKISAASDQESAPELLQAKFMHGHC